MRRYNNYTIYLFLKAVWLGEWINYYIITVGITVLSQYIVWPMKKYISADLYNLNNK